MDGRNDPIYIVLYVQFFSPDSPVIDHICTAIKILLFLVLIFSYSVVHLKFVQISIFTINFVYVLGSFHPKTFVEMNLKK